MDDALGTHAPPPPLTLAEETLLRVACKTLVECYDDQDEAHRLFVRALACGYRNVPPDDQARLLCLFEKVITT